MLVRGRVKEAVRVAKNVRQAPPVLTYIRYVYTDTLKFLTEVSIIRKISILFIRDLKFFFNNYLDQCCYFIIIMQIKFT